jgi:hypothetical protein
LSGLFSEEEMIAVDESIASGIKIKEISLWYIFSIFIIPIFFNM